MRRFEYVGGTSEKFWEVEREGSSVTVRFGRIGTAGQTQVKDLGTPEAADAHVAKLVAEKVKKGYVEGAAPTVPAADAGGREADERENTWTVPAPWWRHTDPWRGVGPARKDAPDPAAATLIEQALKDKWSAVTAVLDHDRSDDHLVKRARLFLGTPGGLLRKARQENDPLGAAAVGVVLAAQGGYDLYGHLHALADHWTAKHGIPFAAETTAAMSTLYVSFDMNRRGSSGYDRDAYVHEVHTNFVPSRWTVAPLVRMRALLAAAPDGDYEEARGRLSALRETGKAPVRVATSYLLPTERGWVEDDLAMLKGSGNPGVLLLSSATTVAQAEEVLALSDAWTLSSAPNLTYSFAAHAGPAAARFLAKLFDKAGDAAARKRLLSLLTQFPTDEAFGLLVERIDQKYVEPAVMEAMERFPRRATRVLAEAAIGSTPKARLARELLRGHAITHPDVIDAARPSLPPAARDAIDAVLASSVSMPVASDNRIPSILVDVPWAGKRPRPAPKVVPIRHHSPLRLVWKPGEQEAWANEPWYAWFDRNVDWDQQLKRALTSGNAVPVLASAPPDLVRPHIGSFDPRNEWANIQPYRRILGRLGDDAIEYVFRAATSSPSTLAPVLAPYEGSEVAELMADWHARLKSIRPVALAWFDRHPEAAARDLVPIALREAGKERAAAESALRLLVQRGHVDAIRSAASAFGGEAETAIAEFMAVDPVYVLPARIPSLPSWLDPAHLPPVLLADRSAALPAAAVGHLCTMLAMSKPGVTYAGVDIVKDAVDGPSLAEMGWRVFERWRSAGFPAKESWALDALGVIGDDETVRRLSGVIRGWPAEGGHKRAVTGVEVLATIGSDVALMHLHAIAEKSKFKALKAAAQTKIAEVAEGLGLTADELADRLVPDFGLEPDGSLLLDYGPRRFRVGFDEQLRPVVAEEDGARRKVLPRPSASDDAALAGDAYARFSALKKDVKTVAADQIRRYEQAMVNGRRWSAAEQRTLFVDHPLLWHLARRLVWATFAPDGAPSGSFRVAEDRTLADEADEEIALDDDRVVGIAHPLHLGTSVATWSELFADYEILQPFPQLGREVYALSKDERSAKGLRRFAGAKVSTGKILGLSHRGWERGTPQDAGVQATTFRRLAGGRAVVVDLDPGIYAGAAMEFPEQTLTNVWLNDGPAEWGNDKGNLQFGVLDDVTASEVLRDLEYLIA